MKSCGNKERAPLRTVLQNFLNHVETLEKKKNGADDQYDKEFQELKLLSESLKGLPVYSCLEGEKEVNRRKNRYKDILPFDYTRVSLSEITGIPGSDYINANYIRGASGSHAYIASQGPLAHTVADFWRMVIECDVQVIIMACNEEESGKHKCENYWVEGEMESKVHGPYTVKLLKARRMCDDFNLRTMELTYTNTAGESVTRTVVQFHYWAWPDHGVPALVRPLLEMVRLIRDCQASETLPLLVHCSAGCGRTGTICAIDYVWGLLRAGKLTEDFSLFELIADMRRQRVAMVQTKDQYILVHRAVRELFIEQLKMIDAHPYENLDVNGHPLIFPSQEIRIDPSYETIFSKENEVEVPEVKEDEDVCYEETPDQIPWPVLQYESGSVFIDSVPPLPDKKRKAGGTAEMSHQESHTIDLSPKVSPSRPETTKKFSNDITSSSSSSKESTPPSSLERSLLKSSDPDPSSESAKEDDKRNKSSPSPSSGLVRKSSILKLRAFFEKSPSSNHTRKASSFRIKEAPSKFYCALDDHVPSRSSSLEKKSSSQSPSRGVFEVSKRDQAQEQSVTKDTNDRIDGVDSATVSASTHQTSASKKGKDAKKPSLPVKRSKSMKVYRGFDVRTEPTASKPETRSQHSAASSVQVKLDPVKPTIVSTPCDIVLSKTPSITYISSKEKIHPVARANAQEPTKKSSVGADYDNLDYNPTPLTTSSLDRAKEQRPQKPTPPSCGSLDRGVTTAQIKSVPTYVNVLIRNQEARSSKLDDDTRQLLQDCQTYLMHTEPEEKSGPKEEQRLNPLEKKSRNRSLRERRHSFKQAVISDPKDEAADARMENSEGATGQTTGNQESVGDADDVSGDSPNLSRSTKKVHEYEAIWLSGNEIMATPPSPSAATANPAVSEENNDNCSGMLTKDSVFIQKSDEIRLLLNELRSGRSNDREPSKPASTPTKFPPPFPLTGARPDPVSPRLHPERVLCELQELVERANRCHEESMKTPTETVAPSFLTSLPVTSPSQPTTPTSPLVSRKPPYVNYPQPPPRTEASKASVPSSPTPARYLVAAPSATSNTPTSAIVTPIPIKLTSPVVAQSLTSRAPQASITIINTSSLSGPSSGHYKPSTPATLGPRGSSPQSVSVVPPTKVMIPISPSTSRKEIPSHAPAFRPPPPYPSNLFVKLPPLSNEPDSLYINAVQASPKVQRRMPPEYKDPPPVKWTPQPTQPVAPPRAKRHTNNPGAHPASAFPMGPPIPGRSYSIQQSGTAVPGVDVDAVAAVMAAENSSPKGRSSSAEGSPSPTTAANKALTKALCKFQATAASFKTKFAQLSDTKEVNVTPDPPNPSIGAPQLKLERESSFVKPAVVYVGEGITVVNTSETTTYVRKKQQYL